MKNIFHIIFCALMIGYPVSYIYAQKTEKETQPAEGSEKEIEKPGVEKPETGKPKETPSETETVYKPGEYVTEGTAEPAGANDDVTPHEDDKMIVDYIDKEGKKVSIVCDVNNSGRPIIPAEHMERMRDNKIHYSDAIPFDSKPGSGSVVSTEAKIENGNGNFHSFNSDGSPKVTVNATKDANGKIHVSTASHENGTRPGSVQPGHTHFGDTFNETLSNRHDQESSGGNSGTISQKEMREIQSRQAYNYAALVQRGREAVNAVNQKYNQATVSYNSEFSVYQAAASKYDALKKENFTYTNNYQQAQQKVEQTEDSVKRILDHSDGGIIISPEKIAELQRVIHDQSKNNAPLQFFTSAQHDANRAQKYKEERERLARQNVTYYFPVTDEASIASVMKAKKMLDDLEKLQTILGDQSGNSTRVYFDDILEQLKEAIRVQKSALQKYGKIDPATIQTVNQLEAKGQQRIGRYLAESISKYSNLDPLSAYNANMTPEQYRNAMSVLIQDLNVDQDFVSAASTVGMINDYFTSIAYPNSDVMQDVSLEVVEWVANAVAVARGARGNIKMTSKVARSIQRNGLGPTLRRLANDPKNIRAMKQKIQDRLNDETAQAHQEANLDAIKSMERREDFLKYVEEMDALAPGNVLNYSKTSNPGPLEKVMIPDDFGNAKDQFKPGTLKSAADFFYDGAYVLHRTSGEVKLYGYANPETQEFGSFWSASKDGALGNQKAGNTQRVEITVPAGEVLYRGYVDPKRLLEQPIISQEEHRIATQKMIDHQGQTGQRLPVETFLPRQLSNEQVLMLFASNKDKLEKFKKWKLTYSGR